MKSEHQKFFWILTGLTVLLLFPGLGNTHLWIYDEARNAECAREMYERSDWIVPTFNGELRTLKPPLHYYFMFGGFELFGVSEWGARFFSAVFGLFTIWVTYFFVKRYSTPRHAFISSLVLLASSHFLFQFRMSVPDPYLIFLNTVSVFTAYAYFTEKRFSWLITCAVSLGLGTLAKGPVSIVLPGASVLVWLLWDKRIKDILSWKILAAGVIMLAVCLPWYLLVHNATDGEWTRGFFLEHNVGRFSQPMEGHGGLFIIVPLFVLLGLLPSSVFIGESVKNFKQRFSNSFLKLAFCTMIVFIGFYSFSGTKLPNYPMPCYPFVALLLGYFISQAIEANTVKKYPLIILLCINLLLPAGGFFALQNEVNTKGLEYISLLLLILAAAGFVLFYWRRNFKKAVVAAFSLYCVFNIVFFHFLYPAVYRNNPLTRTIETVQQYENVIAYRIFHPSFTYYLPERVREFHTPDSLKAYLDNHKAAIISRKDHAKVLDSLGLKQLFSEHDIFEVSTTVIYTNEEKLLQESRRNYK